MAKEEIYKIKVESDYKSLRELNKAIRDTKDELVQFAKTQGKNSEDYKKAETSLKNLQNGLRSYKDTVKDAGITTKLSFQQAIEIGENLTVVSAGLFTAFNSLSGQASELLNSFNALETSNRKLSATAKLTGTSFEFLKDVTEDAQVNLGLTIKDSNELTIALTKLGQKAGDTSQVKTAIESLLDLGAAQGLTVEQTLVAINQALLGIDEGTDKLFQKNPSQIYKEYADSIGTTAGKLTDQQKAQALLNETIEKGGRVQGEYNKFLDTFAGKQQLLSQKLEVLKQEFGSVIAQGLEPFIDAVLSADKSTQKYAGGLVLLGGAVGSIIPIIANLRIALAGLSLTVVGKIAAVGSAIAILGTLGGLVTDLIKNPAEALARIETIKIAIENLFNSVEERNNEQFGPEDNPLKRTIDGLTDTSGIAGTNTSGRIEKVKTSIDELNDRLEKTKELLGLSVPGTKEFQNYIEEIDKITKKIEELSSVFIPFADILKILPETLGFDPEIDRFNRAKEFSRNIGGTTGEDEAENVKDSFTVISDKTKLMTDYSLNLFNNISNSITFLDEGTQKFVSDILGVFNTILSITETIKAVNSIASIIPFLATGGTVAGGGMYMTGEVGPELFIPKTDGTVFSHRDTNKIINKLSAGSSSNVSVYINADIDGLKFLRKNFPKYENFKRYTKIN